MKALPSAMRAMAVHDGGLRCIETPLPVIKPGEILVRTAYAGVNHADLLQVAGKYPPPEGASPLPGLEVSGEVVAVGQGATGWKIGDAVCALLAGGGYAEYVAVLADHALPVPAHLGLRAAAALPEASATAVMALMEEAKLQAGERVLLHGGTSGVGVVMAQLARNLGAEVFATVGTEEKCDYIRKMDITPINHRTAPFAAQLAAHTGGAGVSVIVDTLGAPAFTAHLQSLKPGGRMVMLAMLEGGKPPREGIKLGMILTKRLHLHGATLRSRNDSEKAALLRTVHRIVWPMVELGQMQVPIDQVFPLVEAEKAHVRMQERLHFGKILLEVAPTPHA